MLHNGPLFSPPGGPRSPAGGKLLWMLSLAFVAGGQTTTTAPAPGPYSSLDGTPKPTSLPTFPASILSRPTSRTSTPTLALYPTQMGEGGACDCSFCSFSYHKGMNVDKLVPPYALNVTCGDLETELLNSPNCGGKGGLPSDIFDMEAYCQCSDSIPEFFCTICGETISVPVSNYLTVVELPGVGTLTCKEASDLTDYIHNEAYCTNWTQALAEPCCVESTSAAPAREGFVARSRGGLGATALGMAIAVALLS